MTLRANTDAPTRIGFFLFLLVTVTACGGLVMVVEVLGSRLIGPFFGVSLYVWTALISVTLIALALGYGLGGLAADRWPGPGLLYGVILVAGLFVLAVPLLRTPILSLSIPLGLRGGAFVAALILFGPPLALMGAVSPIAVRLAVRESQKLGRMVGGLYALSTLGSVAGTVATGFFLIGTLGVSGIFTLTGLILIGLAGLYFLLFRRFWPALALALIPLLPLSPAPVNSGVMPDGTRIQRLAHAESHYGQVTVLEFSHGAQRTRELLIDGQIQGGIDPANGLSIYEYAYALQHLPVALHPEAKSMLVIGLGAGIVPTWHAKRGLRVDIVDIDANVVRLAGEHFGFATTGRVIVEDARAYLQQTAERYDLIVLDVFNGDTTPGHVLSQEALALARSRLNPGGMLMVNLIGSLVDRPYGAASVSRTMQTVFERVGLYPVFDPQGADASGNIIMVAYDGPERPVPADVLANAAIHPMADSVRRVFGRRFVFPAGQPADILTDDFNPIDVRDAWLKERIRRAILEGIDWRVL